MLWISSVGTPEFSRISLLVVLVLQGQQLLILFFHGDQLPPVGFSTQCRETPGCRQVKSLGEVLGSSCHADANWSVVPGTGEMTSAAEISQAGSLWSKQVSFVRLVATRPPIPRDLSSMSTRWPLFSRLRAQLRPARPAPTTAMVGFIK
eukprot:TRINITY_DN67529_c3_g4_i4.p1 TRINITY_DN67529_c3_g4~~TRINITY_DN67529_c3_g4_i4.p1  ORF type:complete len:149 (-),score=0.06 TRINITY_DN67529_c3_g4_i4:40-486(-)